MILSSGNLYPWKVISSKTALKEYGSFTAMSERILRLSWIVELLR